MDRSHPDPQQSKEAEATHAQVGGQRKERTEEEEEEIKACFPITHRKEVEDRIHRATAVVSGDGETGGGQGGWMKGGGGRGGGGGLDDKRKIQTGQSFLFANRAGDKDSLLGR